MNGIATIAVGEKAKQENVYCLESIKKHLDIDVITLDIDSLPFRIRTPLNDMQYSRIIKTYLINCIPQEWQYCIYLDSDTRVVSKDILKIFDILQSGYDLVIVPSSST